jgi:hypothetical protein
MKSIRLVVASLFTMSAFMLVLTPNADARCYMRVDLAPVQGGAPLNFPPCADPAPTANPVTSTVTVSDAPAYVAPAPAHFCPLLGGTIFGNWIGCAPQTYVPVTLPE